MSGCDLTTGGWRSYYDGEVWTDSSDVDIDHLVPLAEAWDSGARRWTAGTRTRFANDLRDPRPLVAVTDNVNQSKSDQDPAEWMPELGRCRYVREWVAVKIRWRLTVNRPEKKALRNQADTCANTFVRVRRAKVVRKAGNGDGPVPAVPGAVRPGTPVRAAPASGPRLCGRRRPDQGHGVRPAQARRRRRRLGLRVLRSHCRSGTPHQRCREQLSPRIPTRRRCVTLRR